jgi:hypothetical protein
MKQIIIVKYMSIGPWNAKFLNAGIPEKSNRFMQKTD